MGMCDVTFCFESYKLPWFADVACVLCCVIVYSDLMHTVFI